MARAFLSEKLWNDRIANFGIDIWMTTIAIARRFKVCQTFLGSPKSHRAKDPAKDLGPMFVQVIMTFLDMMVDFEYLWKDTIESWPSSIFGFGLGVEEKPPEVNVNTDALYNSFISVFEQHEELWEKVIPKPEFIEIKKTKQSPKDKFYYPSDLWARILFNFAIAYRNNEIPREQIIEAMIPFYHSRILSFVNKTGHMNIKECEEYFEDIKDFIIPFGDKAMDAEFGDAVPEVERIALDSTRAKDGLDWIPLTDFETGVNITVKSFNSA